MKHLEQGAVDAMATLGERGRTTRIPDEVREAVVAFGLEARAVGTTWKQIGDRVGLSASVVQRWCRAASPTSPWSAVTVRPEVASVASGTLVLVTPSGYRIEGLGVGDAERLLVAIR